MKKLIVEYRGYKLKVEICPITDSSIQKYPYIKATCEAISFTKNGNYGNYQDIIDEFMEAIDREYEERQEWNNLMKQKIEESNNKTTEPCIAIIQQILKRYPSPECKKHLHCLVLDLKCRFEKEYGTGENQ